VKDYGPPITYIPPENGWTVTVLSTRSEYVFYDTAWSPLSCTTGLEASRRHMSSNNGQPDLSDLPSPFSTIQGHVWLGQDVRQTANPTFASVQEGPSYQSSAGSYNATYTNYGTAVTAANSPDVPWSVGTIAIGPSSSWRFTITAAAITLSGIQMNAAFSAEYVVTRDSSATSAAVTLISGSRAVDAAFDSPGSTNTIGVYATSAPSGITVMAKPDSRGLQNLNYTIRVHGVCAHR